MFVSVSRRLVLKCIDDLAEWNLSVRFCVLCLLVPVKTTRHCTHHVAAHIHQFRRHQDEPSFPPSLTQIASLHQISTDNRLAEFSHILHVLRA